MGPSTPQELPSSGQVPAGPTLPFPCGSSVWLQDMTGEGRVELGRRALVREEFSVGSEMPGTWGGCPKKMLGTDQSLLSLKRKNGNIELIHRSAGRRVDRTHTRDKDISFQ